MRKGIILFLSGFFIFQFASAEVHSGLFVKAGYCAEAPTGLSTEAGGYAEARAGLSAEAGRNAEKEKVDPNEWDFGQVKQGVILKHDFVFKNQTKDILKINNIHTSCGCTASESDKKSLLPQESTAINVTFNSQGYSGLVTQFVYVNTDNADLAIIKFTIKAQVVKD
jgi:hypothetical protein